MTQVITFFFEVLGIVWSVIYSSWMLSISFMIAIMALMVGLFNQSKSEK